MSDAHHGLRAMQLSTAAAAVCGFCGYFAARRLDEPFVDEEVGRRGALVFAGVGFAFVVLTAVYATFLLYRATPRTKMLALFALVIALGGSYAGWTLGWKKGGGPSAMHVL